MQVIFGFSHGLLTSRINWWFILLKYWYAHFGIIIRGRNTEIRDFSWCQLCHHWCHQRLSTSGATSDDKVGIMMIPSFQWTLLGIVMLTWFSGLGHRDLRTYRWFGLQWSCFRELTVINQLSKWVFRPKFIQNLQRVGCVHGDVTKFLIKTY